MCPVQTVTYVSGWAPMGLGGADLLVTDRCYVASSDGLATDEIARDGEALPRSGSIGVAFTPQSRAIWELAGRGFEGKFPSGISFAGGGDLIWLRWSDSSEAVEFWLDEAWIERISGIREATTRIDPRTSLQDPVLYGVGMAFCRAMASDAVDPLHFEALAIAAARRIVPHVPRAVRRPGQITPLDDRRLRLVDEFVEANLDREITLEVLARLTSVSVFHFAKRFRAAAGTSPYAYVVGRRMNRAMQLLRGPGWPVARVAQAVGYSHVGHFRRQFVAHWGQVPGRLDD
jgi:AraC family transcriptional regulator